MNQERIGRFIAELRKEKKLTQIDLANKFVFVTKDYGLKSQVIFKDCSNMDFIPNDTTNFRKFINIINWLNGEPFKLKQ